MMTGAPGVTPEELLLRVREEVQRRDAATSESIQPLSAPLLDERTSEALASFDAATTSAEQWASVGLHLPPMTQMRGIKRWFAVPVANLILRAARLLTREQGLFNHAIIAALRPFGNAM